VTSHPAFDITILEGGTEPGNVTSPSLMNRKKQITIGVGAALVAFVGGGLLYLHLNIAPRASGYVSKILCSSVFVSGRDAADVLREDLGAYSYVQTSIDHGSGQVDASVYGMGAMTAVYREGLGCTIAAGADPELLRSRPAPPAATPSRGRPWPTGDVMPTVPLPAYDMDELNRVLDEAFAEPNPVETPIRTRAIVVVHRGRLIAERYAEGYDADTPLLGWSMSKSVTAALIGIAEGDGVLDVDTPAPVPEWAHDGRAAITTDQLMRMSSGLAFEEVYGALGDATAMLFMSPDTAGYAANSAVSAAPDTVWSYSSGTSNLLARILRDELGDAYVRYPRERLFDPIGAESFVFEPDASGTFVGSSFTYATARDWARFGMLHLQDGVWEGERILPEGWVARVTTATPTNRRGEYGGQWWLNVGDAQDPSDRRFPTLPRDLYQASGFESQAVVVIPSAELVVVRLGQTPVRDTFDLEGLVRGTLDVVSTVPEPPQISTDEGE
jgi:CubicO group peptidase (beta-lactamase class C family)